MYWNSFFLFFLLSLFFHTDFRLQLIFAHIYTYLSLCRQSLQIRRQLQHEGGRECLWCDVRVVATLWEHSPQIKVPPSPEIPRYSVFNDKSHDSQKSPKKHAKPPKSWTRIVAHVITLPCETSLSPLKKSFTWNLQARIKTRFIASSFLIILLPIPRFWHFFVLLKGPKTRVHTTFQG